MLAPESIDWTQIKLVIFDVDGTLYDQKALRRRMSLDLLRYVMMRPWRVKDLLIIQRFRKQREALAHREVHPIDPRQYDLGHIADESTTKALIHRWIHTRPLKYLTDCTYPKARLLWTALDKKKIKTAVLSDYPVTEKLAAMGIRCAHPYTSEASAINVLKPHPKGIIYVLDDLGIPPDKALYIGDRTEVDGEAARRAGVAYLEIPHTRGDEYYDLIIKSLEK